VAQEIGASDVVGLDWSENLAVAESKHPRFRFKKIDLNIKSDVGMVFDFVTCFETLEHVGNISNAVDNIHQSCKNGGVIFISVPIEIGVVGIIKFLAKRVLFCYKFHLRGGELAYFRDLMFGERIGKYRQVQESYGSHFGFDYRDVDDVLKNIKCCEMKVWNSGTTRFYLLTGIIHC
jgi:2-polyprenyl-3-methyl-5-hydroxy-6-metoxy-1,4-benzoquinol methylase